MVADHPPPQVLPPTPTPTPTIVLALTTQIRPNNLSTKHIQVQRCCNYVVPVNSPDTDTCTLMKNNKDDVLVLRDNNLDKSGNHTTVDFDYNEKVIKCEDVLGVDNDVHQEKLQGLDRKIGETKSSSATVIATDCTPLVSPYFAKSDGSKRIRMNKPLFLNDQSCGIEKNVGNYYRIRNSVNVSGNDNSEPHVNEERVVSQYFVKTSNKDKKRRQGKRKPLRDQPFGALGTQNDRLLDKISLPRGVSLGFKQKADCPQINKVKHADHKQNKLSVTVISDVGDVKGVHKEEKKKRNRKQTIPDDQSYGENQRVALNVTSSKLVSPYILRKGARACEHSLIECLKQTKKKVRKQRNSKIISCEADDKLETEDKKIKRLIDQCCIEQHDKKKSFASDGLRITAEHDLAHETICQNGWVNPGSHHCEDHKENKTGDVETQKDCVNHGEGCITNAKKKRVKSLHRLKIGKTEDDQAIHGDLRACDSMITSISRKVEKKMKKKTASPKCGTSANKEDNLVSLSIGSQINLIHDGQDGSKTSAAKVVSPYFQKLPEKFECDVERDESNCKGEKRRRLDRTANIEFEELVSKYAYKSGSHINREVDLGEKEEEDGSALKSKRKGKKKRAKVRSLSAAEKRAEAYQRKAPDCTWRPPRSPYNLLQEDHSYDPWRVLVICILLNITTGPQVKRVLSLFFEACPNAEAAVDADELRIASLIQSLGLHRKRAAMIQRFSREYLSDNWTHVTQLHGIGKYAADAYAMFCNGKWHQVTPNDHMLNYYWNFLQNRGLDFKEVVL